LQNRGIKVCSVIYRNTSKPMFIHPP